MGFRSFVREWIFLFGYAGLFALLCYALLSGMRITRGNTFLHALEVLTRPALDPVRRHLPRPFGWDLSPLAAMLLAWIGFLAVRYLLS